MKWTKCAIRFLRISRPGVRVPSIAPRKTSTHCVLVFLFCLRDGRGSNRAAAHSAASNQPSGLLLSPRVPTRRNVYRGSCKSKDFMAFLFFWQRLHTLAHFLHTLQKSHELFASLAQRVFRCTKLSLSGRGPDKLGGIGDKGYHGLRSASRWFCKFYCSKAVIVGLIS